MLYLVMVQYFIKHTKKFNIILEKVWKNIASKPVCLIEAKSKSEILWYKLSCTHFGKPIGKSNIAYIGAQRRLYIWPPVYPNVTFFLIY